MLLVGAPLLTTPPSIPSLPTDHMLPNYTKQMRAV